MTSLETIPSTTSSIRLAVDALLPAVSKRMAALDAAAEEMSLPAGLLELVRTRASQLNGCAYCTDSHSAEALQAGEDVRKLLTLPVWRESPFLSAREQAALELTEAITLMSERRLTDQLWDSVAAEFSELEMAELVWTIAIINTWNRVAGTARPWPIE